MTPFPSRNGYQNLEEWADAVASWVTRRERQSAVDTLVAPEIVAADLAALAPDEFRGVIYFLVDLQTFAGSDGTNWINFKTGASV